MIAVILLIGAVVASAVIAQGPYGGPPAGGEIPEESVRKLLDGKGNIFTPDQRLARIAVEHKGGFGGYYFDEANPGHVFVYMLDLTQVESAEAAFREAYSDGQRAITQITPVQGDYAFNDWLGWYRPLMNAMAENGMSMASGAVMEAKNRIVFGLPDMTEEADIRRLMRELGVPEGAGIFEEEQIGFFRTKIVCGKNGVPSLYSCRASATPT